MNNNSFYSQQEISEIGFADLGSNVLLSRKASIYSPEFIKIGNNARIDDFCILSGKIEMGSYVHISAFVAIYGKYEVYIDDFSGLSPGVKIFSATDDFSGEYLINPMVPSEYTNVTGGKVSIEKYVQLGTNTVVMPNLTIAEGSVTGAFCFVNKSLESWGMYIGIPAKRVKERSKKLLQFINEINL